MEALLGAERRFGTGGHASCYSAHRAMLYTFIYAFIYLYVYLSVYFSGYETRGRLRGGPGGCRGEGGGTEGAPGPGRDAAAYINQAPPRAR